MIDHGLRTARGYPNAFKNASIAFAIFFGFGAIINLAYGAPLANAAGVAIGGVFLTAILLGIVRAILFAVGAVGWRLAPTRCECPGCLPDGRAAREVRNRVKEQRYKRGLELRTEGKQEEAVGEFDAVIAESPSHAGAFAERGFSYGQLGRQDQAVDDLERAKALTDDAALIVDLTGAIKELREQRH